MWTRRPPEAAMHQTGPCDVRWTQIESGPWCLSSEPSRCSVTQKKRCSQGVCEFSYLTWELNKCFRNQGRGLERTRLKWSEYMWIFISRRLFREARSRTLSYRYEWIQQHLWRSRVTILTHLQAEGLNWICLTLVIFLCMTCMRGKCLSVSVSICNCSRKYGVSAWISAVTPPHWHRDCMRPRPLRYSLFNSISQITNLKTCVTDRK